MKNIATSPVPGNFANSVDSSVCSTIFTTHHQESLFDVHHFPKVELIQESKPMTDDRKEVGLFSKDESISSVNLEESERKVTRNLSEQPRSEI